MPTYRTVDAETKELCDEVMQTHHPLLKEAGVTVQILTAHAKVSEATGEPVGPALKLHGVPALAIVKVTSLKDRVGGIEDARIILDGDQWPDFGEERQRSILDHELTHLVPVYKDGFLQTDDANRPKLKTRPHDADLGVFFEVVERHGMQAVEAQAYRDLHNTMTQMKFPWG